MNVLSVDFDYFIDTTLKERVLLFPDSGTENWDWDTQILIWTSLYSTSVSNKKLHGQKDIREIGVLNDEIDILFDLVDMYIKEDTQLLISESHKEIASLINKNKNSNEKINVYNIDFHDDCFSSSETEIHCGNWARILVNEKIIDNISWIKRHDSEYIGSDIIHNIYNSIQELYNNPRTLSAGIDHIFICRSGMWSPPHLDDEFVRLAYGIAELMDIDEPNGASEIYHRWNNYFKNNINNLSEQIQRNIKI